MDQMIISAEVQDALKNDQGVVALESTVITHGLPFPENLDTAISLEETVRKAGCVPATIALMDGIIHVGLKSSQLEQLAKDGNAHKVSRRDLPYVLAKKRNGGTTVATTMLIAEKAGIKVFATGGIGGVHRDAENSFDISADLEELARTSVCVVCAGAKAVLDLPKTLEVLETKGVPVISYQSDEFPAFYYRDSRLRPSARLDTAEEIASLLHHKWKSGLGLDGGVLIANPIAKEDAMDREEIEGVIAQAIDEMTVVGRDVTPYLLARVSELSAGKSKVSNIALLKNNAGLAAEIAKAWAKNC